MAIDRQLLSGVALVLVLSELWSAFRKVQQLAYHFASRYSVATRRPHGILRAVMGTSSQMVEIRTLIGCVLLQPAPVVRLCR